MRILLAFACFFRILFTGKLPARAAALLPAKVGPDQAAPTPAAPAKTAPEKGAPAQAAPAQAAPARTTPPATAATTAPIHEGPPPERRPRSDLAAHHREGALALLGLLQREGRLVDFLRERLDQHQDAEIGAAVRDIHRGCRQVIDEHFVLEAVMPGDEDSAVKVPAGFDPGEVRLIGEVKGEPPFRGVLRHHGWRVVEVKFPTLVDGVDRRVVAPAEVEVSP
jgi:hypothetical protein